MPVAGRARHEHAGAGQPVGDLERERRAVVGVERHEELVAVELAQRVRARGQLALGRGRRARRSRRRASPSPRRARRAPRSWTAWGSWPRRRSCRAPGRRRRRSPRRRRPSCRPRRAVADGVAVVAARRRRSPQRLGDRLLVRAALRRALVLRRGDLVELLLLGAQAGDLEVHRLELLVHRPHLLGLLAGDLVRLREVHALEDGERVGVVVGGELLAQVLAHLRRHLAEHRVHAVLDGDRRLVAEVLRQRLGHVPVLGTEDLVDLRVEPLGDLSRALDELARRARARSSRTPRGRTPRWRPSARGRARARRSRSPRRRSAPGSSRSEASRTAVSSSTVEEVDREAAVGDLDAGEREGEGGGGFMATSRTLRTAPDGLHGLPSWRWAPRAAHQRRRSWRWCESGFARGLRARMSSSAAAGSRPSRSTTIAAATVAERCIPARQWT